jgi:nucleotide-binding universal stress UspA family protein
MSFRDIVVFLDPTAESRARLKLALNMASTHDARVVGVDTCSPDAYLGQWRERAVMLQDDFEATLGASGVPGVYCGLDPSRPEAAVHIARFADLAIAPPPEFEARALVESSVPEGVVLASGVPTLIVPSHWKFGPIGQSVVIAWNNSREATRAVHDAMPLLRKARQVTVFTIAADPAASGLNLLVDHLQRHGVKASTSHWVDTGDLTVVQALLACLEREDSDLIVAGAFSHARWVENVFGGVSHDLIRLPGLPVLMSH